MPTPQLLPAADWRDWHDDPAPEPREPRVRCPGCRRRVPARAFAADLGACSACVKDAGEVA